VIKGEGRGSNFIVVYYDSIKLKDEKFARLKDEKFASVRGECETKM
jgi:hypothetical protein